MSIESINRAAAAIYAASQAKKQTSEEPANSYGAGVSRSFQDIISLSPEGIKISEMNTSLLDKTVFHDENNPWPAEMQEHFKGMMKKFDEMMLKSEYGKEMSRRHDEMGGKRDAIQAKLLRDAGGLLSGVSYTEDFSTIKTTSGRIHPNADQIRSFLHAHSAELNEMNRLQAEQHIPFEQWKAERA